MAGSVDLADPTISLPRLIAVDTNLVFERLAGSFGFPPHPTHGPRAEAFIQRLRQGISVGIVLPAVFTELTHVVVRASYQRALRRDRLALTQRYGSLSGWTDLYKRDPSILRGVRSDLVQLAQLLAANRLFLFDPDRFLPIASGRSHDEELIHVMCEYGLDSGDALMLLEAQRAPVLDIATLDADLLRAQRDLTIYAWL